MNVTYGKIPVIIPALNPDNRIFSFISSLKDEGFTNIVVVDDGSDDAHRTDVLEKLTGEGITVLEHNGNKGKGVALKTGMSYVYRAMNDSLGVITADYDGRQRADAVAKVADKLINGTKLVLGVRDLNNTSMSNGMRRGYKLTGMVFRLLYTKDIKDIQTGLRGITYSLIPEMLEIKGKRYEYEPKMLVYAVRNEIPVEHIDAGPIRPLESDNETLYISDNFRTFADSFRISIALFLNFLEYALTSITATIVDFLLFFILSEFVFVNMDLNICVLLSTILARVVSATLSFTINRKIVFKSDADLKKSIFRFYTLSALVMLCSAELVTLFVTLFGGNKTITKLFVDLCLFFVSYQIQQRVIFRKK